MARVKLKSRTRARIVNEWRLLAISKLTEIGVSFGKTQPKNAVLEYLVKEHKIDIPTLLDLRADEKQKILAQRESEKQKEVSQPKKPVVVKKHKQSLTIKTPQAAPAPIGYKQRSSKSEKVDVKNISEFYKSWAWKDLRLQVIKKHGRRCMCCGASPSKDNNVVIHVDHIKPVRIYPELALDINNLQVLCEDCNMGKGYWDESDFRKSESGGISVSEQAIENLHVYNFF